MAGGKMGRRTRTDWLVQRMDTLRIEDDGTAEPLTEEEKERKQKPFRFLDLPYELRLRIYDELLVLPKTVDLDPENKHNVAPRLRLFLVNKQVHEEAARVFYSRNTFRVFPIGRYINRKHPLLAWLPRKHRAHITRLELRLGQGFTSPPKGWVVGSRLGLAAAQRVFQLRIFVEIDPETHPSLEGFRLGHSFYTEYCVGLLRLLLAQVPSITQVEFDAYPSVKRTGSLVSGLVEETKLNQKRIVWGMERGWDEVVDVDLVGALQKMGIEAL
jgi:hypothetical protein